MIRRHRLIEHLEPRTLLSASMVKDINTTQFAFPGTWSSVAADPAVFLSQDDGVAGWELYKTDGTTGGTVLVKDIRPGRDNSQPGWLTHAGGGTIFFTADDGTSGIELWKSDGTSAGTVMVKDINPGAASSSPGSLLNVNGTIYFSANDGANGFELWKSDGSDAGTVLVKNIATGTSGFPATPTSSGPAHLINNNGTIFFRAFTTASGFELWKSDGTELGTVMVKEIAGSTNNGVNNVPMAVRNGFVYFSGSTPTSGSEIWRSDGSDPGTTMVKEIYATSTSSSPTLITTSGSYVYFNVAGGAAPGLYRTDGTDPGTIRLHTASISTSIDLNGSLVFMLPNPSVSFSRIGLYKTDGNTVTTIDASLTMSTQTGQGRVVNGTLYFSANTPSTGEELWKTDGTPGGTGMVIDIEPGTTNSNPLLITPYGPGGSSGFVFSTAGGPTGGAVFRSNGTAAGTVLVKDISPNTDGGAGFFFTPFQDKMYFAGFEAAYGNAGGELYRSDGTEAGTGIFADMFPGPTGSSISALKVFGNHLYFTANDGAGAGKELWRTDGTSVSFVKDINGGSAESGISAMTVSGNYLYFRATTAAEGEELWRTDGTNGGTLRMSNNITIGSGISLPTDVNGTLYYTVVNSSGAFTGLWKSDGFGSVGIATSFTAVSSMININGTLFIAGTTGGGSTLWKISPSATTPTQVSTAATLGSSPNFTNVDGTLFFAASGVGTGTELWKSDGTTAGTVLVENINPGSSNSSPTSMVAANGVAYFRATDAAGSELWRSDGTAAGTYLVKDITPAGATNGAPTRLFAANGFVYFAAADDNSLNPEAWRSDGTAGGTAMLGDYYPEGSFFSLPSNAAFFAALDGEVYYMFSDETHGSELWKAERPDFAVLGAGGALTVSGTGGNDVIDLSTDGSGNLHVTLNDMTESFAPGAVTSVRIAGHVGGDTVNVTAGTVAFGGGDSGAATADLTIHVAAGASATFNDTQHLAALDLDGGSAALSPGGNKALVLRGLTMSGAAVLDMTDNDLVLDYDETSPLEDVAALIASGFNGGDWLGVGIVSSSAAQDPTVGLGYADNASLPVPYGSTLGGAPFGGVDVDDTAVLIKFTWVGDLNLDGLTEFQDLSAFHINYDYSFPPGRSWFEGDFNYDGVIDFQDLSIFYINYDPNKPPL